MKKKKTNNIEKLRKAITSHRGGLAEATDGQIIRLWNSLDEQTKREYLENSNHKAAEEAEEAEKRTSDTFVTSAAKERGE